MGPGGWIRGFAMAARGFRGVSLEVPSGRQVWVQSVSWADGSRRHQGSVLSRGAWGREKEAVGRERAAEGLRRT